MDALAGYFDGRQIAPLRRAKQRVSGYLRHDSILYPYRKRDCTVTVMSHRGAGAVLKWNNYIIVEFINSRTEKISGDCYRAADSSYAPAAGVIP